MNLIAAVDNNWAIGKNNQLLVRIPMDQKFFREMTTGKVVVRGRKTLQSFPNSRLLKIRTIIVLTLNPSYEVEGAVVVHSLDELKNTMLRIIISLVDRKFISSSLMNAMQPTSQRWTSSMMRMHIFQILTRSLSGRLRETAKSRHTLIWSFISFDMRK